MSKETTLLESLSSVGAFASTELHKRSVPIGPKKKADVFVREIPDSEYRALIGANYDRSKLIAAGICDADGKPVMSAEQAATLKPRVAYDLEKLVMTVNASGDADAQTEQDEAAGKS